MTDSTHRHALRRVFATRANERWARALAIGFLGVALAGCSLRTLAHPMGLGERAPARREPATPSSKIDEAKAQSAASPAEPYWPYHLAQLYLESDSTARAEAALGSAIARDSLYAPALSLLSKIDFDAGRHAQAIERLEAARAHADRFPGGTFPPVLLADLALHQEALGRHDRARELIAELPRSMRNETVSTSTYLALRGDAPDSAGALATAALHADPRSAANQNNYGITRLRAGDLDAARHAFGAAIEIDPRLPGPYYNLAILERFYALDDAAGARWFGLYRQRSGDDPDGLAQVFEKHETKTVAEKKDEP
jgi:tetratricopeptide (TPR) repeat protein